MKVVVVWHAAGAFPERLIPLGEQEGIELAAIAPQKWSKGLVSTAYPPEDSSVPYRVIPAKARCQAKEVFHFYPRLCEILSQEEPDLLYMMEEHYALVT